MYAYENKYICNEADRPGSNRMTTKAHDPPELPSGSLVVQESDGGLPRPDAGVQSLHSSVTLTGF